MKPGTVLVGWFRTFALPVSLLGCPALSRAADVVFYAVTKSLKYNQDTPAAPTLGGNNPYRIAADVEPAAPGSVLSASITGPVGPPQALELDPTTTWLSFNAKFPSQSDSQAGAPAGQYTFTLNTAHDGPRTLRLSLPVPVYPSAPHLSNFQAAQTIDPGRAFTLTWDPLAGGTTNDFAMVLIVDSARTTLLFRSPGPSETGALNGTSTSLVIPAGSLPPNAQELAEITFVKVKSVDRASYSGVAGIVGFGAFTDVSLASGPPSAPPLDFEISFRQFAQGGEFVGSTNVTPLFPALLNGFRVEITVTNDSTFAAANQVLITGPPGSGLTNMPCDTAASAINARNASYFSPRLLQPATAPGGAWLVNYKGTTHTLTVPDPQLSAQLIIPLPRIGVAGDLVKAVAWTFVAPSGASLPGAPGFVRGLHVQALDSAGAFILDSGVLPTADLSYELPAALNWSAVRTLRFMYNADRGDSYVVTFPKIAANPFALAVVQESTLSGFVLRLNGEAGRGYLVQFTPDLTHWTDLVKTNLLSPSITLEDRNASGAPIRFYRAQLTN